MDIKEFVHFGDGEGEKQIYIRDRACEGAVCHMSQRRPEQDQRLERLGSLSLQGAGSEEPRSLKVGYRFEIAEAIEGHPGWSCALERRKGVEIVSHPASRAPHSSAGT